MTTTKSKTTTSSKTTNKKNQVTLPKNPLVFEVLGLVSKQRSKAKKIEILRTYNESHLRMLFIWNFDESVISLLPEGEVPYSDFDDQATHSGTLTTKITEEVRKMYQKGSFSLGHSDGQGRTTIRREAKNFYHFIKGGNDAMNAVRRETMFINILQGLHPLEAEILCLVKDKQLSDKYKITKQIVAEAYPDIKWGGRS